MPCMRYWRGSIDEEPMHVNQQSASVSRTELTADQRKGRCRVALVAAGQVEAAAQRIPVTQ